MESRAGRLSTVVVVTSSLPARISRLPRLSSLPGWALHLPKIRSIQSSSRIRPAAAREAGRAMGTGLGAGSAEDPASKKYEWIPLPHPFGGTDRLSCTARVEDKQGFTGTCAMRYSAPVHVHPGGPEDAGISAEAAAKLPVTREAGSAEPGDHVSCKQLEDYLHFHCGMGLSEARHVAHLVAAEYDLFPRGLLLIHQGLDR